VPEICRFFGIVITMYYNDHVPPHFHAEGTLSPRALGLVIEWASAHKSDLMTDWALARSHSPLKTIDPLR